MEERRGHVVQRTDRRVCADMQLEDLEQVLRHMIEIADVRANADSDVGVELAGRVDFRERRFRMEIVARIADRPDASRVYLLEQSRDARAVVGSLDDEPD